MLEKIDLSKKMDKKKEKQAAKEAPAQGKGTRQSMRGLKSKGADGKENKAAKDGKDKDKK